MSIKTSGAITYIHLMCANIRSARTLRNVKMVFDEAIAIALSTHSSTTPASAHERVHFDKVHYHQMVVR